MQVLSGVRKKKARTLAGIQWICIHTEFYESPSLDSETLSGDELTHTQADLFVFIIRGGKEVENYS